MNGPALQVPPVGDKGQRYEVIYCPMGKPDLLVNRLVLAWTDDIAQARRLRRGINRHPAMACPRIVDRTTFKEVA